MDIVRVQPYRMTNEIVSNISKLILNGEIASGDRLPGERDLAKRFGVSRPTLGKALHVLEALGLIEVRSGGGTYVSRNPNTLSSHLLKQMLRWDKDLMVQLIDTRLDFEGRNAELAAQQATTKELRDLEKCLAAMAADVEGGRDDFQKEADFHLGIAEATHNRVRLLITTSMLLAYFDLRQQARQQMVQRDAKVVRDFLREHRSIYEAIKARNGRRARSAMEAHLEAAHRRYSALVVSEEISSSRPATASSPSRSAKKGVAPRQRRTAKSAGRTGGG
ncbi:MAG: FadR/GntR family transcriptional regulator [Thermodesulfobacteriota bacterium]